MASFGAAACDNDPDNLAMLTDDSAMRARLRQLIMDQTSKRDFLEAASLSDLEGKVDRAISAAEKRELGSATQASVLQEDIYYDDGVEEEEEEDIDASHPHMPTRQKVTVSQKIGSNLEHISKTFSSIFQALLVIMRSGTSNNLSSLEESRATKRSKDFEVRLGRLGFELKQKVSTAKSTVHRLDVHPTNARLRLDSESKLHQCLRAALSLLTAYQQHLPLSAGKVYPRTALEKALDALSGAAKVAADLGYNSREMTEDVDRLRTAAEKHWNGEEMEDAHGSKGKVVQKRQNGDKKAALEVINNLAREKFGAANAETSPKKTNLKRQQSLQKRGQIAKKKQNVVLPRGNRLLEERARLARAKRLADHQSMPESDEARKRITTFSVDHFPDATTPTTPRLLSSRISRPHSRSGTGGRRTIDLDEDELEHIIKHRRRQTQPRPTRLKLGPSPDCSNSAFSLAGLLADKLVGEAVRDVCQEVAGVDMVTRLFKSEFKL